MNKRNSGILAACVALALGWVSLAQTGTTTPGTTGTGTTPGTMTPGTTQPAQGMTMAMMTDPDRAFVEAASMSNQFEIQHSRVILQKSANAAVKRFAQRMIDEHTKMEQDMAQLLSTKGMMKPPGQPGPAQMLLIARLSMLDGATANATYVAEQITGHQMTASTVAAYIRVGRDAQLKAMATRALPMILDHLKQAQALAGAVR